MLDGVLRALENLFYGVIRERVEPEFLDLLDLLGVWKSGVVLVVVVQPEQGENLVDGLYAGLLGRLAPPCGGLAPSLPRRCR